MITKELLKEVIIRQKEIFLDIDGALEREILRTEKFQKILDKTSEIVMITGVRRAGKSYLMRLIWRDLKRQLKVNDEQCLYFNFEDERLIDFKASDFNLLLEAQGELFNQKQEEKIYLFFDEIQNVAGWDKFLYRLRENKQYKIFVTGSNATLLSREISSKLTGRNIQIRVYPFSWREYLRAKEINIEIQGVYKADRKRELIKLFDQYLQVGGFPEVIISGQRFLLQEYLQNIIYRDIVSRYKIKYERHLREIVNFLITNMTHKISLSKVAKMTGIKNINTIKNYLGYLENSFLFYSLPRYSYSLRQQIYNPDKWYVCDTGMYNELSFRFSENRGKVLENFVLLEFLRQDGQVFYGEDKDYKEIDFVGQEKNKISKLVQSTWEVDDSLTRQREIESLKKAMLKFKLKEGLVVTYDYESEEKFDAGVIKFVPGWKYFLRG